jgi:putative transposase
MKVVSIDVNQKYLVCASPSLTWLKPNFNYFYINNKTKEFLVNFLKFHEIDIVIMEDPNILSDDIKRSKNNKGGMKIVSLIKDLKKFLEENEIKVIFVNPRNTSSLCPLCNKKLEAINNLHVLKCPNCNLKMHKDKIASWNILNRGLQKIRGVKK